MIRLVLLEVGPSIVLVALGMFLGTIFPRSTLGYWAVFYGVLIGAVMIVLWVVALFIAPEYSISINLNTVTKTCWIPLINLIPVIVGRSMLRQPKVRKV